MPRKRAGDFPEIEYKFSIESSSESLRDFGKLFENIVPLIMSRITNAGLTLLLPYPHGVIRARRYHLCHVGEDEAQGTVVEAADGRLSTKVKSKRRVAGDVLVRQTETSSDRQLEGKIMDIPRYIDLHNWKYLTSFQKEQIKIPVKLENGSAFLLSIDHCNGQSGVLNQLEIEYIGNVWGNDHYKAEEVIDEASLLAQLIRGGNDANFSLQPTTKSKYDFFTSRV